MSFTLFLFSVVGISFSGVASPGPLTFLTISSSYKNKNAGILVSLGHGIVEGFLIFLISIGIVNFLKSEVFKIITAFLGGLFFIFLGLKYLIKKSIKIKPETTHKNFDVSLVIAGSLATVSNPYFFIWWFTVGSYLIIRAAYFGSFGIFIFGVIHWLCDFLWYYFLSKVISKSKKIISEKIFDIILKICGVILLIFSVEFIRYSAKLLLKLI
ncbi:MAG: LysE family transporter [Endomicrobiia bacterium]